MYCLQSPVMWGGLVSVCQLRVCPGWLTLSLSIPSQDQPAQYRQSSEADVNISNRGWFCPGNNSLLEILASSRSTVGIIRKKYFFLNQEFPGRRSVLIRSLVISSCFTIRLVAYQIFQEKRIFQKETNSEKFRIKNLLFDCILSCRLALFVSKHSYLFLSRIC